MRKIIRFTAQFSVILFSIAFSASSLHLLLKTSFTKQLVLFRPHIGLAFGTIHFIHLMALVCLQSTFHPVFTLAKTSSLFAGGIAYLFILIIMITTIPRIQKSFKSWKLIHTIGSYWIWVIFFNSYFKNVINKDRYYGFLLLLIVVILLRIYKFVSKKKTGSAA